MYYRGAALALIAGSLSMACAEDRPPVFISTGIVAPTQDADGPYRVVSLIRDDRRVSDARVRYTTDLSVPTATTSMATTSTQASVAMAEPEGGDDWIAALPSLPLHTVVTFIVIAEDHRGQQSFDLGPDARGYRFTVGNVPSLPEILTLSPSRGPTSGETEVFLVGRDFREDMIVEFGGVRAETLEVISRTQARVRTPAHAPGVVDLEPLNFDGGTGLLVDGFEYFPAPEIFEVVPDSGPTSGGTEVEITGRRFAVGADFLFGGVPATNVRVLSEGLALARTPANPPGPVVVRVTHPELGFGEREDAFTYIPPPEILSIVPNRGPDLGGTLVEILGRNLLTQAVTFDGIEARIISNAPERILVETPAHPVGFSDVRVTNRDGQFDEVIDGFFFFGPPELDQVIPPHAASQGGAVVVLQGENFSEDTIVTMTVDGQDTRLTCSVLSEQQLSCLMPATRPGFIDLAVTNPDGRGDQLADALAFFTLDSVVPGQGPSSGGTPVTVFGRFLPTTTEISFAAARAMCIWIDAGQLDCLTPAGPPGFVDVSALPTEPGQVPEVLRNGYEYIPPPVITALSPDFGPLRGGQTIRIIGTGFQAGATVTVGGAACTDVVFVSDGILKCTVPPGPPGLAEVVVNNPDGQSGNFVGYEYVPITFTPEWGLIDGFANMEIRGAGFAAGAAVLLGGESALAIEFINPQFMRARTAARATTGGVDVVVRNPGEPPEVSPELFSFRRYRDRSVPSMAGQGETSDVMITDLDNDGDNDMVFVNGSNNAAGQSQTVENLGGGTNFSTNNLGFNDVSNEGNFCDINNDGRQDLTWGISGGGIRIYRNNGNFSFNTTQPPTTPGDSFEAAFFDVTGDGRCDLINLTINGENEVFRNDAGNFVLIPNAMPHEADFIHDHKLDSGDLDGDGDNDVVVVVDDVNFVTDNQRHRIYLNNGSGSFSESTVNRPLLETVNGDIFDVRIGDIDGDGDNDIVMPNIGQAPALLLNNGSGVFTRNTTRIPNGNRTDAGLVMYDMEGDGDLDLLFVHFQGPGSTLLLLNDGEGFYAPATAGGPAAVPDSYRATSGDINGDGAIDLLFGAIFAPNAMYFAVE